MRASALPEPRDTDARLLETSMGTIAVSEEGPSEGWPVLCIHGIPGSRRDFRYVAPLLAASCRVIRVEMPGFGSSPSDGADTQAWWGRVPAAVADALEVDRYAVMGHSYGGGAALLAGAEGGERVAALFLLASMGARPHRAFTVPRWVFGVAAAALKVPLIGRVAATLARAAYRRQNLPAPPAGDTATLVLHLRLIASVSFPALRQVAEAVAAPALVVHCRDDRLVEPAIARELASLLPRGELLELPSGGHHLQKTRAREVAAAVIDLLTRIHR